MLVMQKEDVLSHASNGRSGLSGLMVHKAWIEGAAEDKRVAISASALARGSERAYRMRFEIWGAIRLCT